MLVELMNGHRSIKNQFALISQMGAKDLCLVDSVPRGRRAWWTGCPTDGVPHGQRALELLHHHKHLPVSTGHLPQRS